MALETGRAGKTDLDWLEHLAGTAKMELQYVFQPGSGVQAAVQGRRITVNLGGAGYAICMLAERRRTEVVIEMDKPDIVWIEIEDKKIAP